MTGQAPSVVRINNDLPDDHRESIDSIQPHGCVIVLDDCVTKTIQVTENAEDFLGIEVNSLLEMSPRAWLGDALSDYLLHSLADNARLPGARVLKVTIKNRTRRLFVDAYRSSHRIVIELENTTGQGTQHLQSLVNEALDDITRLNSVNELLNRLVAVVADLTGHERVFVGVFSADDSVEVVAEHTTSNWQPLLNYHFPPCVFTEERQHFLHVNPVRHAHDITGKTIGFYPPHDPETGTTPDLSPGLLRAIPSNLKDYLSKMGIRGSLAIALRSDRSVWGVLVSHTAKRKRIAPGRRHAVRTLVQIATQRLFLLQHRAETDFKETLEAHRVDLLETFNPPINGQRLLARWGAEWARLFEADGQALLFHHEVSAAGVAPPAHACRGIIDWISRQSPKTALWHCRTVADLPIKHRLEGIGIAGMLAVRLPASQAPEGWWLLFRRETAEVIRWIGEAPEAVAFSNRIQKVRPGFPEIIHEQVHHCCQPWSPQITSSVPRLAEDIGILASSYAIRQLSEELDLERHALRQANKSLERLAHTDRLTNIPNRLRIEQVLANTINSAERYSNSLSILLFDIDHFKQINDTYGHDVGDDVLVSVATAVQDSLRPSDTVGRWGGEEFVVIAEQTDREAASQLAERLRQLIAALNISPVDRVTVSIGVAEWLPGMSEKQLVRCADQAMYIAKQSGRNRVVTGN